MRFVAGDPKSRSAAGAVSAAVRELRAVEIVGIYETQQESLEVGAAHFNSIKQCKCTMQMQSVMKKLNLDQGHPG